MNIPLNIDLQQILLHLLNFSVLTLGLYLLLYNPVKKFMDERKEHYCKLDKEAQEKLKEAQDLERLYKERLDSVETEVREIRAKASQEMKLEADAILQKAKEQAAKIISDAQEAAQKERKKIIDSAQEDIASIVMEATEKLLAKSASSTLDQFLDSVREGVKV